jgi:K+-sensing histidine kinase KdpD
VKNARAAYSRFEVVRTPSRLLADHRPAAARSLALSLATVALATAVVYPLKHVAPVVSLGVVYLLGVLVVSICSGLAFGVLTGLLSALAFNWFHLPPVHEWSIHGSENWVALIAFAAVAAIASSVAEVARSQAVEAEEGRRQALLVAELSQVLRDEEVETAALRRSDELKTALLRAVSHDLRSPLTAMVTAGHALRSTTLSDSERDELARAVVEEGERLSAMVEKLLDLSRLQAGRAAPMLAPVAIDEVLEAAVERLGGSVELRLAPELPLVEADAAQLERAFANLVENAVKHAGDRPVQVRAKQVGERLVVRVVDQGRGLSAVEAARVFEAFHRGPGAEGPGAGLGLAIAKGFVESNGGTIAAEPVPGQGTSFVVSFPVLATSAGRTDGRPDQTAGLDAPRR